MAAQDNARRKRHGRLDTSGAPSRVPGAAVADNWRVMSNRHPPDSRPAPGPIATAFNMVGSRVAELLNVCAIYLGIAVLVTLAMVLSIAPLRGQLSEIQQAVHQTLRPENVDDVLYAMLAVDDTDRMLLEGLTGARAVAETGRDEGSEAAAQASSEDAINFARLLRASMEAGSVEGVTAKQEQALRSYLARKYRIASSVAGALIKTAFVVAKEMELDPQLILAVIAIESRYNPYAESHVGAQGLMQVMTRVHKEKFTEFSDGTIAALHPIANIRVGSRILRDCIKRRGSIERGLACYVGATGPSDGGYGAKVLAEQRRIALASGIPVGR